MATYSSAPSVEYVTFKGSKSGEGGTHHGSAITLVSEVPDNVVYELEEFYGATDSGGMALTLMAHYDTAQSGTNPDMFTRVMPLFRNDMAAFTYPEPVANAGGSASTNEQPYTHSMIGTADSADNSTAEINEYRILTESEMYERRIFAGYAIYLYHSTYEINDGDSIYFLRFKKTTYN